ncbi:MAG: DUF4263 domain-containing protein [Chloroflexi bacterium]|nr:DUF4263 domain-containing protein [Chloroflexota bacterium]
MAKSPILQITIENDKYAEFKGFKINFIGFDKVPWRFSPKGFTTGKYILGRFKERFGEFGLTIVKDENSRINTKKSPVQITIKYEDALRLAGDFKANYKLEGIKTVTKHLSTLFPREFPDASQENVQEIELSIEDIQESHRLLPVLAKYKIKSAEDLKQLFAGRKVLHYLSLEKVLKEFARNLKIKATEHEWQTFFKKHILILNPGYIKIIEKPNISLSIQLPDFLLLSIEDYVDVYEIKVPRTPLLQYDGSHHNYYWSTEMAKAISQVENYVDSINKNSDSLRIQIREQYHVELRVVRPRGYIIAGHSDQLKESKKRNDDFRLLNESLRSTEILPYDIFLERFKSFSKTLKEVN